MKYRILLPAMFATMALVMTACSDSDDEAGNDAPPAGALPSAEFTPNNLPNEPYAEDAVRVVAENTGAPFYSLELMPDGYYLLMTSPYYYQAPAVGVEAVAGGGFSVRKGHETAGVRTRGSVSSTGTITFYGGQYGKYTKVGTGRYSLDNGVEIYLVATDRLVYHKDTNGTETTVNVSLSTPMTGEKTRSLCRTWMYNSFEAWGYMNGKYVAHGKQVIKDNGEVESYFKGSLGIERDEFLDEDDELARKVIFTAQASDGDAQHGTYICFFLDGDVEIARWNWINEATGILLYDDYEDDEDWGGYTTVRFAGNQMRVYEDATEREDGMTSRMVAVNTLTAVHQ